MAHEKEQDPKSGLPSQEEIDKKIEEFKRSVTLGANEAQQRLKKAVNRANDYFQQIQVSPPPNVTLTVLKSNACAN